MRILILNWRDPGHPLGGGAEIYLFRHAQAWQKKGYEVVWFSSSYNKAKKFENIEGIEFVRAGSEYTVYFYALLYYLRGIFGRLDLVIDSFHGIPFFAPLYVFRPKVIALVHEVAGKIWFVNVRKPLSIIGYVLEILSYLFYKKTPFITVSKSTKNDLIKRGIATKNIHVIPNGLDRLHVVNIASKEPHPTLVFLGRIAIDKGVSDLLKAFNYVIDYMPKAKLWIVGREETLGDYIKIREKSLSSKAKKGVKYFGYVDEEEKYRLLSKAWLLVHPSMKEGWGLNVIEAASVSTPTIGYDVEGLRDSIVDGKTGILSEPNHESLAKCILSVANDGKKREQLSLAAKKWSDKFDWEVSVAKSTVLINNLLKE